jgi:hypothetical protein
MNQLLSFISCTFEPSIGQPGNDLGNKIQILRDELRVRHTGGERNGTAKMRSLPSVNQGQERLLFCLTTPSVIPAG